VSNTSLPALLLEWSRRPFSYGYDCCQFAGAVLEHVKGYNPMDVFDYSNEVGAAKAIAKYGNLVDATTAILGAPLPKECPIEEYDVVACLQEDGTWLVGIVIGDRVAVKTKASIMDWPLEYIGYRWRV